MAVLIRYTDGTEEYFEPDKSFSLLPLTVYLRGTDTPIESITYSLQGNMEWEGDLTSLSITGDLRIKSSGGVELESKTISYSNIPPEGEWFDIDSITVTGKKIEDYLMMGSWSINGGSDILLSATFADGTKDNEKGNTSTSVGIDIKKVGVTSLSVTMNVDITNPS